jgi:hypothetical protein
MAPEGHQGQMPSHHDFPPGSYLSDGSFVGDIGSAHQGEGFKDQRMNG